VLRHQRTTLIATVATLLMTLFVAWIVPKGFFPQQDTGLIVGVTEAGADVSFPRMMQLETQISDVVQKDPDVDHLMSFIGADGTNATVNSGRLSITLKPRRERKSTSDEVIARLKPALAQVTTPVTYLSLDRFTRKRRHSIHPGGLVPAAAQGE